MAACPIAPLHLKLEEFRQEAKFSDVTIIVEGKTFACHRFMLAAASSFFDSMFFSKFKESSTKECHLSDIDSELFEEVLRIIYTGKLEITEVNFFDLLRISEFLSVSTILDPCINFVLENIHSIDNVIEIFLWARTLNVTPLSDPLLDYISNEFFRSSENVAFLEMPFDDFHAVLVHAYSLHSRSQLFKINDFIMDAIVRWIHYSYAERRHYFEKLSGEILSMDISVDCSEFLMKKYKLDFSIPEKRVSVLETHDMRPLLASFSDYKYSRKNLSMHLYLGEKVFSISKCKPEGFISHRRKYSIRAEDIVLVRSSHESDYLYSFKNVTSRKTSFRAYSSVGLSESSLPSAALCPPPVCKIFNSAIDEENNNIYIVHSPHLMKNGIYPPKRRVFSDEEFEAGTFRYNCQLDEWFAVPQMEKEKNLFSRLIMDGNLIYSIFENGYIHAYDVRTSQSFKLPNRPSWLIWHSFDWCIFDNKIYSIDNTEVVVFDLTAARWDELADICPPKERKYDGFEENCMVPYDHSIWVFHEEVETGAWNCSDLSVHVLNRQTGKWKSPHHGALSGDAIYTKCGVKNKHNGLDEVILFKSE